MKIENIKSSGNKLKFTLKDSSYSMANAIRRTMMTEIPTMAIDEIDFYENNSSMFDEYLGHRMGLIPIAVDAKAYNVAEECCNGGCSKCSTMLTLDVIGPKTVLSGDLKPQDEGVKIVYDGMPIMKLEENQSMRLEAKAILGKAKDHARFQPCLCFYSVKKDETAFDFEVESYGNYKPEELLEMTLEIMQAKLEELEKQVK